MNIPHLEDFQPTAGYSYQHMTPRTLLHFPTEVLGRSPQQSVALPGMHTGQS